MLVPGGFSLPSNPWFWRGHHAELDAGKTPVKMQQNVTNYELLLDKRCSYLPKRIKFLLSFHSEICPGPMLIMLFAVI